MKKQNSDRQSADELLKKLQRSYGNGSSGGSGKQTADAEDAAFRNRVAKMLNQLSGSTQKPHQKKSSAGKSERTADPQGPASANVARHDDPPTPQKQPEAPASEKASVPAREEQKPRSSAPDVIYALTENDVGKKTPEPEVASPAKEPATEPAKESTKRSADTPAERSTRESIKEPVQESAKEPAKESVKESVKEPAKESAKESVKESAKESVKEPSTEPAIESTKRSSDTPAERSVRESIKEPVQESVKGSVEESDGKPTDVSAPSAGKEPRSRGRRTASYRPSRGVTLPRTVARTLTRDNPPTEKLPVEPAAPAVEKPVSAPSDNAPDHVIVIPPVSARTPRREGTIVIRPKHTESPEPPKKRATSVRQEPVAPDPAAKKIKQPEPAGIPAAEAETPHTAEPAPAPRTVNRPSFGGMSIPRQRAADPAPAHAPAKTPEPAPSSEKQGTGKENKAVKPSQERKTSVKKTAPAKTAGKKPSAFSQRREKKRRTEEETLDATEMITRQTGLNENDIAMIFELGYENELGKLVGHETLKRLKYEHLRRERATSGSFGSDAFGYRGREYSSAAPAKPVLAAFAQDRGRLILRIALLVLLAVLAIPADFPTLFGATLTDVSANYPYLFPLAGLILLILAILVSLRHVFSGWRAFLRFAPTPDSPVAVAISATLIYSTVCLIGTGNEHFFPMTFPAVSALLSLSVCDALRIADQMRTFRLFSAPVEKTVLEETEPRKKRLRLGKRIVKILNDEEGEQIYRVRRTGETVGFFHRVNDLSDASHTFSRFTILLLVSTAAAGISASLWSGSGTRGILAAVIALMSALPISAVLLFYDPLRRANRRLTARGTALIGEESVAEYSGHKTVIFSDVEVFLSHRKALIAIRDGDDFRRDMRIAGILFRKLSGTLDPIGQNAPGKKETDPPVVLNHLTETGVDATVDGQTRVLAGSAAFLTQNGISVPKESTDRSAQRGKQTGLLYVAIDGTVRLSYEIGYEMTAEFGGILRTLEGTDTVPAIYSCDPCLSDPFLREGFSDVTGEPALRSVKPVQPDEKPVAEVTDSGIVSLKGSASAAFSLRAAALIASIRKRGMRWLSVASLLGAVLALCAAAILPPDLLPWLPLFALGYRVFWSAIALLISSVGLRKGAIFGGSHPDTESGSPSGKPR